MARIKKNTELGEGEKRRCEKKKTSDGGAEFAEKKRGRTVSRWRDIVSPRLSLERAKKNLLSVSFFFCAVLANYIIAPMSVSRPYILSAATTVSDLNKSKVCEKFANLP